MEANTVPSEDEASYSSSSSSGTPFDLMELIHPDNNPFSGALLKKRYVPTEQMKSQYLYGAVVYVVMEDSTELDLAVSNILQLGGQICNDEDQCRSYI